jgi:hypothetical protein
LIEIDEAECGRLRPSPSEVQDCVSAWFANEKKVQSVASKKVVAPSCLDDFNSEFGHNGALVLLEVIEEAPDEMVLTFPFGSQLEAPVARVRGDEFHRPLNRAMKTSTLDRNGRPKVVAFEI